MAVTLTYRAYAKLNLYLDVLSKRRDGYHNIETVFQSVNLADEITLRDGPSRAILKTPAMDLDTDNNNLVVRAAELLRERTGVSSGADIRLVKRIPLASGLAGGSADAAAALTGLNELWETGLSRAELSYLAAELGADVPYFLWGGTVAGTLRGDNLIMLEPLPETWFVLVHPNVTVSTARVYNSARLRCSGRKPFAGKTTEFRNRLRALSAGDLDAVVYNAMEETVFAGHPHLADIKHRLLAEGCTAAAMSGSGATIFGVCSSKRFAMRVAERLPDLETSVVHSVSPAVERDE